MSATSVSLNAVTRLYGPARALDRVSLTAPQGQVMALLGPSGSGKSTILRLIAGLEPVDGGEIRFSDDIVSALGRTAATETRRVGMVFQDYALFPHLNAEANVAFGLGHMRRYEREHEALDWLARVGLSARAQAYPHELSGGEQQRVALARALAPKPRAVLLDEPFSGLDPVLREELRDVTMAALAEAGATALFVTHDAEEALLVADRLAILKGGRLLQEAAPREAYNHPTSVEAAAALGPINTWEGFISSGALVTPFGAIASNLAPATKAKAAVRAEAISLAPGSQARVVDRRPHGAHDLVRISAQGATWRALVSPRTPNADLMDVTLYAEGAFVFSA